MKFTWAFSTLLSSSLSSVRKLLRCCHCHHRILQSFILLQVSDFLWILICFRVLDERMKFLANFMNFEWRSIGFPMNFMNFVWRFMNSGWGSMNFGWTSWISYEDPWIMDGDPWISDEFHTGPCRGFLLVIWKNSSKSPREARRKKCRRDIGHVFDDKDFEIVLACGFTCGIF